MSKKYQFETLQIHAGQKPDPVTKATGVPLYLSNAFTFDSADQAKNIFALEEGGYFYSRLSNPTVDVLQQRMAALDGGVGAIAFASGTAAIMGLIMTVCQSGDEIIAANNLYGGTIGSLSGTMQGMGFTSHFVNPRDLKTMESLINEKTKMIFVETPTNPMMKVADIADALCFEAQNGVVDALDPRVHQVRPHSGQLATARNLLRLLDGSKNTTRQGEIRVQDAYSLRCSPQIHGASKDAVNYVLDKINIEINSVTDNPIIFKEDQAGISGGNFHGQPMALSFDFLGIGVAELANVSERRIERLVNPAYSNLPAFLTPHGGVCSGFMIVQYSAAALVSENKVLAHPASVDSIPSSAGQEDHVSMGTIAARKAGEIAANVRRVLAMELMVACQGIDMRGNKGLGKGTQAAYDLVRSKVATLDEDRELYGDINYCEQIIADGSLIKAVEEAIGGEIETK